MVVPILMFIARYHNEIISLHSWLVVEPHNLLSTGVLSELHEIRVMQSVEAELEGSHGIMLDFIVVFQLIVLRDDVVNIELLGKFLI